MMSVGITDDGTIEQTELSLAEIRDDIAYEVALRLDEVWIQIKDLAIEICPKESGALAASVEIENQGGSGAIGVSGIAGGDFYSSSIYAGNQTIVNPITGKPTAEYALFVHDGHAMPNGGFYEGVPFLTDAVDAYQAELDACVDRAMSENNWNYQD
jgi:hypothetical protein